MSDRSPGGSSRHIPIAQRLRSTAAIGLIRRTAIALAALLLVLPAAFTGVAAASTQTSGSPGAGASVSEVNAYLTTTEEEEAEEAEEAEAEELEEAEEIEEAEEGEAEAAEEEAEEEEAEEAAARRKHVRHGSQSGASSQRGRGDTGSHASVSSLTLSATTKGALAHGAPTASKVGFSFALTSKATVHFSLSRAIGKSHWQTVSSVSVAAGRGTDHEHLYGTSKLASGQYRLTLTPSGGHAAQLTFAVK